MAPRGPAAGLPQDGGLRPIFSARMPEAQWTPVETGSTATGVPDHEFCFPCGTSGWVEYKLARRNRVVIRPMQVGWIERRIRLQGRVFIAIRRITSSGPKTKSAKYEGSFPHVDTLIIVPGQHVRTLFSLPIDKLPGRWEWTAPQPVQWPWDQVRAVLTGSRDIPFTHTHGGE